MIKPDVSGGSSNNSTWIISILQEKEVQDIYIQNVSLGGEWLRKLYEICTCCQEIILNTEKNWLEVCFCENFANLNK